MAKERKRKTLVHKHAVFHTHSTMNLRQLLALALAKQATIGERRESLGPADQSPEWRLIGQYRGEAQMLFGVLMTYMPGTASTFVVDDEKATTFTVEQFVAPKTNEGKTRERLDGTLFFAVVEDHLVMMQSPSLRSMHLETHLQWLLHHAEVLDGTNTVRLVDQLPKAAREKVEASGVRELEIGGDLADEELDIEQSAPAAQAQAATSESSSSMAVDGSTSMVDALKSLLKPDEAAKLNLDALAGSNIEYTLKIRYRTSTTDSGQKLMNTLGSALRNAEGVNAKIHLVGGGTITGANLQLSGKVQVTTYDGVPNPDEVFEAMRAWLLERVNSGDIQA